MIRLLVLTLLLSQQASRPTQPTDAMPPPDLDYFLGTWSFEWKMPESPLGPGGKLTGTETYKRILGGLFYESKIDGNGPMGPFKGRAIMGYNKEEKTVTRYEIDSSGVSTLKTGPIGGDLGGYYTIFWESTPIKKDGKTIKLKGKTHMYSPAHYRMVVEISVDGGPYKNLGSPWFRKNSG
ncbi:MAG TPA: DUF1579 family protein [Blastocatellia bacterium]|nr:DUF1579 family protein [Blastocatellia bacterium]